MSEQKIFLAITGASGSIYAQKALEVLLAHPAVGRVYLCASPSALKVVPFELGLTSPLNQVLQKKSTLQGTKLRLFSQDDLFAPIASGSSAPHQMLILPCSMGTLGRIRMGLSQNLIERGADVMLKSKRPLILCLRETPLSPLHLDNMAYLAHMGVHMLPLMPGFYHHPKSLSDIVDFMVGRILELLSLEHHLYPPWNARMC